jgi:hypothetical protein
MRMDGAWEVADTAAVVARIRSLRTAEGPFDVAVPGESDPDADRSAHEDAGATWWVEAVHPWRFGYRDGGTWPVEAMRARLDAGP